MISKLLQKLPTQSNSNVNPVTIDEESIISKVLARVPSGGMKTYEVAPLEKIKKDFLEEAKNKILKEISELSDKAKKSLKYLETRGVKCNSNELVKKCFLYNQSGGDIIR